MDSLTSGLESIDCEEKYDFVKDIPPEYKCMICSKLMREPQVTECCGQHFCQNCLKKWMAKSFEKQCPHCRLAKCNYIRYLPMKREINELEIYCLNRANGCTTIVALNQIDEHVGQCDFEQVKCVCGSNDLRKNLKNHQQHSCPNRLVKCQYCNTNKQYWFINFTTHQNECPDFPIDCPQNCGASGIKRKNLKHHKQKCPLELIECQYSNVGCKEQVQQKDSPTHLQKYVEKHLELTMAAFTNLSAQHKTLQKDHEKLKTAHAKLTKEHNASKKKAAIQPTWQFTHETRRKRGGHQAAKQSTWGHGLSQDSGWRQRVTNWDTVEPYESEDYRRYPDWD